MSSPVYYPESNLSQQSKSSLEVPQSQSESSQKRKRDETEFSQAEAMPMEGGVLSQNEVNLVDGQELPEAQIWGTDIIVGECLGHFDRFLKDFKDDSFEGLKYQRMLEDIEETQTYNIEIDCKDLHQFNPSLYGQLINYPQEILPLFDAVVNRQYRNLFPDDPLDKRITVKAFNLVKCVKMRDIDPDDIDCLIAFTAMVTRVSVVIPDLKIAFFRCERCRQEEEVEVDRERVAHPKVCKNNACKTKNSYTLIHNRSTFTDKQLVRVQETPEAIPEGETPQTVDVFFYGDLIDTVRPGDRVEITGVYRAVAVRVNNLRRNTKAVYRSYINAVHVRNTGGVLRSHKRDAENHAEHSDVDEEKFKSLAKDPDIYQKLTDSIAPSIWELEDVKKGLLCMLFGGVGKDKKSSRFRSEINVLLCGDPGTAKSQLLQYVHKLSERGIYTSGKGSSAVGLTASVAKDPDTHESVLESGALVLSDKGVCCIDEFDKMADAARSILHEAMEQQTISVAKAGVICTLNARTSVLAAANPRESRYDPSRAVTDNIRLPPPLLSRFDLIYLVLDKPNERLDRRLARHLVAMYGGEGVRGFEAPREFIEADVLMDYIAYARREVHPRVGAEAAEKLIKGYLDLRKSGRYRNKKVITATPRQLESLIRISEALARMSFSPDVSPAHVEEAIRLMRVATQSAATDPKTGIINMDLISIGQTKIEQKDAEANADLLIEMFDDNSTPRAISALYKEFAQKSSKRLSSVSFRELVRSMETRELLVCKNWQRADPVIARVEV